MNDKDSIRNEISRDEWIAGFCGVMVIVGLALEIYWSPDWHIIIANALVGLGVGGEVWFGRRALMKSARLDAILEKETAEANARAEEASRDAAEANLKTERLRLAVSWRSISQEQLRIFQSGLSKFRGSHVAVLHMAFNSAEASEYSASIAAAFRLCGLTTHEASFTSIGYKKFGIRVGRISGAHEDLADAIEKTFEYASIDFLSEMGTPSPIASTEQVLPNEAADCPAIYVWYKDILDGTD